MSTCSQVAGYAWTYLFPTNPYLALIIILNILIKFGRILAGKKSITGKEEFIVREIVFFFFCVLHVGGGVMLNLHSLFLQGALGAVLNYYLYPILPWFFCDICFYAAVRRESAGQKKIII